MANVKFKVGDKVRIIEPDKYIDDETPTPNIGCVGVVKGICSIDIQYPYVVAIPGYAYTFDFHYTELELAGPRPGEQLLFDFMIED